MNIIDTILVPIDFSTSALNAYDYALNIIRSDQRIKLILLHVLPEKGEQAAIIDAMNQFDTLKNEIPNFVQHLEVVVERGELLEVLKDNAKDLQPNLVIMGTKGCVDEMFESNSCQTALNLDQPLLIIPSHEKNREIKSIAIAVDEQIDDKNTLRVFHDLARWFNARVHILTINDQEKKVLQPVGALENTLEYYMDTLDFSRVFPENADVVRGLEEYVIENDIDILTILPNMHAKHIPQSPGDLTRIMANDPIIPLLVLD